jgi:hypothetical protein
MPTPQIKDEKTYQALRREGNSEEKSAGAPTRPPAARASKWAPGGGKSPSYDERTKKQLVERAREIGIKGRSSMSKQQLISALRH